MRLRFTIITPTLNRRRMLEEALDSVGRQNWSDVEHIVVDGGSTDGTLDWLSQHPTVKLITGSDAGVYDAMNKGLAHATGDVIGFLNSDDYYLEGAFEAVAAAFDSGTTQAVSGNAEIVEAGHILRTLSEPVAGPLAARTAMLGVCLPNTRFFRRDVFHAAGQFDATLRLVADRDFLLRLLEHKVLTVPLARTLYAYRRHAGSLTFDADRAHAMKLRGELLRLAQMWARRETATPTVRHLARLLEGRSRIGLLRDGRRELSLRKVIEIIAVDRGLLSLQPAFSMIMALIDYARSGRIESIR